MSNELSLNTSNSKASWGKANPRRGAGYEDQAIEFLKSFPIGTALSAEAFDEWAQLNGYLDVPVGAPKKSDEWMAHLQRRHQFRYSLNKAAAHPRMKTPFVIEADGLCVFVVNAVHTAISEDKRFRKIQSVAETKRKQLCHLMQSADWAALPPHYLSLAESIFDDIDMFRDEIALKADGLARKFDKLSHKLKIAVERGEIKPRNGGIRGIIESPQED